MTNPHKLPNHELASAPDATRNSMIVILRKSPSSAADKSCGYAMQHDCEYCWRHQAGIVRCYNST